MDQALRQRRADGDDRKTAPEPAVPWFLRSARRLFGTLFLALALLMGALAMLVSTQARRSLEAQATSQNLITARLGAGLVEEHFDSLRRYLESFARRILVANTVAARDVAGIHTHLKDLVTTNSQVDRVFVTDIHGVLWADYPHAPEVIGKSFRTRDWFKGVSQHQRTYVSGIYRRTAAPQLYLVAIAVPIRNNQHDVVGYLVGQHTIDALRRWLSQIEPSAGKAVTVVDQYGVLAMARSESGDTPLSLERYPPVQIALAGREGSERIIDPLTNHDSLVSYAPVASLGWVVLARAPIAVVFAPIAAVQRNIFVLIIVFFVVMVGLGFLWLNIMRRYHRVLSANEERFRSVAETANDAIISANALGVIVYFNRAAERDFGYAAAEALGQPLTMLMPPRFHDAHCAGLERVVKGGTTHVVGRAVELVARRRNGEEFPIELSLASWKAGTDTYFTGMARDITRRHEAERQIRELNAGLDRHATELEAVNKELEAFSYSVSHDLRAPLRAIDGFSQALIEDYRERLDATGQDFLGRVRTAAQRMGELIDDLLKLARVTRTELNLEEIDMSALAEEVARDLRQRDPIRDIELVIAPQLRVRADPRLLRIALGNLLDNAWKFTGGRAKALVEFGVDQRNGAAAYYVRDNGAGFDIARANKLFGAFQRLHDVREFPGTGIGLATVQRVIHKHGGRVWAEGAVNQGASFYFTIGEADK